MPNNDLISRKALIELLSTIHMDDVFPNWWVLTSEAKQLIGKLGERFEREILYIPAVDAEPIRHGKYGWVGMDMLAGTRSFYYGTCSECKERINFAYEHKNYCPNCGAKMEKST